MTKSKKSNSSTVRDYLNSFDLFTMDVQFRENGQDSFSTNIGLLMSFAILVLILLYGNVKVSAFLMKSETSHQTAELIDAVDEDLRVLEYEETKFEIITVSLRFEGVITDPVSNQTYTSKDFRSMVDVEIYDINYFTSEINFQTAFQPCT